jgi:hypothetical protein
MAVSFSCRTFPSLPSFARFPKEDNPDTPETSIFAIIGIELPHLSIRGNKRNAAFKLQKKSLSRKRRWVRFSAAGGFQIRLASINQ